MLVERARFELVRGDVLTLELRSWRVRGGRGRKREKRRGGGEEEEERAWERKTGGGMKSVFAMK